MNNDAKKPSPAPTQPASESEKSPSASQTSAPKPAAQWVQPDTLKRLISTVRTL
jgi:hypothetical protein